MRCWEALIVAALTASAAPAVASSAPLPVRPKRIVSLNLCSDQYVLALADRDQIAGLTRNATNVGMSAAARRARGIHLLSGSAEEMLALDPDLVIGVGSRRSPMLAALPNQPFRIVDLTNAESYDMIIAQIREVAIAVGHRDRGEALIARMERALATLPRTKRAGIAAYYERRGFLTGAGTLVDDLMRRVGLANLATTLGKPVFSQMGLEQLIAANPDYLIVESATDRVIDQGTEMLHHPLLKDIRRLRIPQAWTVCGGPAYVLAAQSLVRQLRR